MVSTYGAAGAARGPRRSLNIPPGPESRLPAHPTAGTALLPVVNPSWETPRAGSLPLLHRGGADVTDPSHLPRAVAHLLRLKYATRGSSREEPATHGVAARQCQERVRAVHARQHSSLLFVAQPRADQLVQICLKRFGQPLNRNMEASARATCGAGQGRAGARACGRVSRLSTLLESIPNACSAQTDDQSAPFYSLRPPPPRCVPQLVVPTIRPAEPHTALLQEGCGY